MQGRFIPSRPSNAGFRNCTHAKGATQLDVKHHVILLRLAVHDLERLRDAGVVRQDVDPAPAVEEALAAASQMALSVTLQAGPS